MKTNLTGLVLLTGVPGSGKTLRMMEFMEAALKAGRPCYACNIDGLNVPGVIPFDDPHQWRELPPTAVLFVDEAQRFFRARRGMVDPPESITAMETIRHDGVCIVLTTQQPTYLDKHLRGLVGHHEHLVEVLAGKSSNVYSFRSVREEITPAALTDATFEAWLHPKRLYGRYKSAEVHTKKLRLPKRFVVLGVGALAVAGLFWNAFGREPEATAAGVKPAQAAPAAGLAVGPGGRVERVLTPSEFARKFLPRFATMPMSAPAYDGVAVVARPQYLCMASGAGKDADGKWREASETCLTEQGTRVEMSMGEARHMARYDGVYNPYKAPEATRDRTDSQPAQVAGVGAAHGDALSGVSMAAPQVGAYGDIGIRNNPSARPVDASGG